MSTREAKIRLGIDGRGAEGAIARLTKGAQSAGSGLASALSPAAGGLGAIAGITGASVGLVALTQQAIQTRSQFDKLQFSVQAGSGSLVDMSRLQDMAAASSDRWKYGMGKLSSTMQTLHDGSGDLEFVRDTLDAVAMAARASGEDLNAMGGLAGDLGEKFGISAGEMESALATVLSMSHQGGLTFNDMSGTIAKLGASAKAAGLDGEQGLKRILGFANFASDQLGSTEQAVEATNKLVAGLSTKDFQTKAMGLGVDVKASMSKGQGFEDILVDLAGKNSGEKLTQAFGAGPEGKLLVALSDVVREGGGGEAGRKKLKESLDQLSRSAMSASTMQEMAAKNLDKPGAKFEAAMSKLEQAFQSDEVAEAISTFASALPGATEGLLKLTVRDNGNGLFGVDKLTNPYDGAKRMYNEMFPEIVGADGQAPEVAAPIAAYKPNQENALFGSFENPLDALEYEWKNRTGFGDTKGPGVYQYTDKEGRQQVETIREDERAIAFGGDRFGKSSSENSIAKQLQRYVKSKSAERDAESFDKLSPMIRNPEMELSPMIARPGYDAPRPPLLRDLYPAPRPSGGQNNDSNKALHDLLRAQLAADKLQRVRTEGIVQVQVIGQVEIGGNTPSGG